MIMPAIAAAIAAIAICYSIIPLLEWRLSGKPCNDRFTVLLVRTDQSF
jgi:hypothetical protein